MNVTFSKILTTGCIVAAFIAPLAATAQNGPPPGPPISELASQMGVSEVSLKSCVPAPAKGSRPERPDPAAVTACLKKDNPSVTQDVVAKAFADNKPR